MDFINLIQNLLPVVAQVVPGGAGSDVTLLATAAANIIKLIQTQGNMTTDEILNRAGVTLDENERMLLDDLARLQGGAQGGSGNAPTTPQQPPSGGGSK